MDDKPEENDSKEPENQNQNDLKNDKKGPIKEEKNDIPKGSKSSNENEDNDDNDHNNEDSDNSYKNSGDVDNDDYDISSSSYYGYESSEEEEEEEYVENEINKDSDHSPETHYHHRNHYHRYGDNRDTYNPNKKPNNKDGRYCTDKDRSYSKRGISNAKSDRDNSFKSTSSSTSNSRHPNKYTSTNRGNGYVHRSKYTSSYTNKGGNSSTNYGSSWNKRGCNSNKYTTSNYNHTRRNDNDDNRHRHHHSDNDNIHSRNRGDNDNWHARYRTTTTRDTYRDPYNSMYSKVDRSSDYPIDKKSLNGLKSIASQTCAIIQAGSYKVRRKDGSFDKVDISNEIKNSIDGTRSYDPDFFTKFHLSVKPKSTMCRIEIVSATTFGCARKLATKEGMKNVCVLNFASATRPGGGFIEGKNAQEESISRQSALYASIYTANKMYSHHRSNHHHHYYTDYMIYSPKVPVFRDDYKEKLLPGNEVFLASVITSAAPHLKRIKESCKSFESRYRSLYERTILERCRKIVLLAAHKKTDALVLGAYGCGVFKNEPKVVGGAFKTVLIDEGLGNYFDVVSFPILNLNSNNARVFKDEFKGYL